MKKTMLMTFALLALGSLAQAGNYDIISQAQIQDIQRTDSRTKISYQTQTLNGRSVLLGVGSCTSSTDPTTKNVTSYASFFRCVEKHQVQLVTIDPKGLFNEKTYMVEGSERRVGVEKVITNEVLSRAWTGLADWINDRERSNLDDMLSQMGSQNQCNAISRRMQSNQNNYTREDKQLIAECFGL